MPYNLYVARDRRDPHRYDLGSTLCLRVVDMMSSHFAVDVYDCEALSHDRPSWLIGTPTLVADSGGDVFRGLQALNRLQTLCMDAARASASKGAAPPSAAPRGSARAPQPPSSQPPASKPPSVPADGDDLDSLWQAPREPDADEDDNDDMFSKKLTSDDLTRATSKRESRPAEQSGQGQPPPPPAAVKD